MDKQHTEAALADESLAQLTKATEKLINPKKSAKNTQSPNNND
jgi:hypothetical protein